MSVPGGGEDSKGQQGTEDPQGSADGAADSSNVDRAIQENRALQSANDQLRNQLQEQGAELETLRGTVGEVQKAQLDAHRALLIAQNPDAVPELIQGDSVEALTASVETAKTVYGRVAEQARGATAAVTVPARVPGAGTPGQALDSMSSMAKIEAGIKAQGSTPARGARS